MRLIDKEQAQKMLLDLVSRVHFRGAYFAGIRDAYQSATDRLDTLPVVEERKHGRWITIKAWHVECSEYRYVLEFICCVKNYCPNCGAIMDGDSNEQKH